MDPDGTKDGHLPPWEVAKAFAFHHALTVIAERLGEDAATLLGECVDAYIANQLTVKGGGRPSERSVRAAVARCKEPGWFPGKPPENKGGRPSTLTEGQKQAVANAAMSLKRQLVNPTPARVRAKLPRVSVNRGTGEAMSDWSIRQIFVTRCFDEREDDPWQFLSTVSKDYLPEGMKPKRLLCGKHIIEHMSAGSWQHHVAFDPCSSRLPLTLAKSEEQKVAAMGKRRWASPGARYKGANCQAHVR